MKVMMLAAAAVAVAATSAVAIVPSAAERPTAPVWPEPGGGWDGVRWGDDSATLARLFAGRAVTLSRPIEFGDSCVDVALRDKRLGGYPFVVYFQMDPATRELKRVQFERQRHGANPPVFRAAVAALEQRYGPPSRACEIPARGAAAGYQASSVRIWTAGSSGDDGGGVVVRATFRDTTIEATEGAAPFDPQSAPSAGPAGLTGQLFVQISPPAPGADACR
jgi:hypothetical protein